MKQRRRIYYNEAQKALMWDRWQKGDSMHADLQRANCGSYHSENKAQPIRHVPGLTDHSKNGRKIKGDE